MTDSDFKGFTPGPWKEQGGEITGNDGEIVADVYATADGENKRYYVKTRADANAALIAAAPDLLAENARMKAVLKGCADALTEAGKDFALGSPLAVRPNLYEIHAEAAREALK